MNSSEICHLKSQLSTARNEIQNLRKQMKNLTFVHQKDLQNINTILQNFRCQQCKNTDEATNEDNPTQKDTKECYDSQFKSIGIIKTVFPEKRGVPRQPSLGSKFTGCIEISQDVFNNPEHSLEGLEDFSHLWIIYHFHKNISHPKSKVAPPRLSGERVGVFSTRSPHRPSPIGLSLVEIERIEGSRIYFLGTDMVDGTPVLDIKPYIPIYDSPISDCGQNLKENTSTFFSSREDPDGEETVKTPNAAGTSGLNFVQSPIIKVPNWIMTESVLNVIFNGRAENQIIDLEVDKKAIIDVLEADPRSVYLRTKYGSQIFTFQLGEVTVTCKFDDNNSTVTVVQIRKTESLQNGNTSNN